MPFLEYKSNQALIGDIDDQFITKIQLESLIVSKELILHAWNEVLFEFVI